MKKYAALFLFALLAATGCSKFEVYEQNLHFMTGETYQTEKALVAKQLEQAQLNLAKAETSGDPEKIKAARTAFNEAKAKAKAVEWEERRRNRAW